MIHPPVSHAAWSAALTTYQTKRAAADALPLGSPGEDEAVDAYCEAMDRLVDLPAPDAAALSLKLDLTKNRWEDFSIPEEWWEALCVDIRRLTGVRS